MAQLARAQKWEEMPALIDDDILHTYAVVGTHDEIAGKIGERFKGVLSDVGFSIAVDTPDDKAKMQDMITRVHAA